MDTDYSYDALLDFLNHASERGLMPATTATALAVGVRNVLGGLDETERQDLRHLDLDKIIRRFTKKRAQDFSPTSLKEYGNRTGRAVEYFLQWRDDPANFSPKTRRTKKSKGEGATETTSSTPKENATRTMEVVADNPDSYHSAFPVRPGHIVLINNIPHDLTKAEADRLAQFIQMLVIE